MYLEHSRCYLFEM